MAIRSITQDTVGGGRMVYLELLQEPSGRACSQRWLTCHPSIPVHVFATCRFVVCAVWLHSLRAEPCLRDSVHTSHATPPRHPPLPGDTPSVFPMHSGLFRFMGYHRPDNSVHCVWSRGERLCAWPFFFTVRARGLDKPPDG